MKKQFLLAVLPALLVLSACSAGPKKANNVLLEDALAHEEIFGEVGNAIDLRVRKTAVQENNDEVSSQPVGAAKSLSAPAVGVQYQPLTNGYYAIRYVAAINDLDVSAVWTRNICKSNGERIKTQSSQVVVTKAYSALAADGGVDLPAENQHYVVYTLRNIPESDLNSYLFAYLTLTKGEESVKSIARISRMAAGNTFTIDTASVNGYFLQGKIGGSNKIEPIEDVSGVEGSQNYAQKEGISFAANDEFGLFKYVSGSNEHFQCFGYNQYQSGTTFVQNVSSSNYAKIYLGGKYSLYLNKSNQIYFNAGEVKTTIYFEPNDSWKQGGAFFQIWDSANWIRMTDVGNGIYSAELDVGNHSSINFCRMNPTQGSSDGMNWVDGNNYRVWNQTQNVSVTREFNTLLSNPKYHLNSDNNDWNYFSGAWMAL